MEKQFLIGKINIKKIMLTEEISIEITTENKELKITFRTTLDRTRYGVQFNAPNFFKKLKEKAIADEFILKSTLLFH